MRYNTNPRSAAVELAIQMERAVRPAEANLKAVEARLAEVEAGSLRVNAAFVAADATFQKLVTKKAPAEEVAVADTARREALEAKRLVAEWLGEARKNLAAAKARLRVASEYAANLQFRVQAETVAAAHRREVEATAKLLCSMGVNPKSAQKAAVAPPCPVAPAKVTEAPKAKAPAAPKRPSLKLEGLSEAWGASIAAK